MRTFEQKPKAIQRTMSAKPAKNCLANSEQRREVSSILHLQHTIGNQAVLRLPQNQTEGLEESSLTYASPCLAHDCSRIPVHASGHGNIQPKLRVGAAGDKCEQEADRVAKHVMHAPEPGLQSQVDGEEEFLQSKPFVQRQVNNDVGGIEAPPIMHGVLRSPGQPLDASTRAFMEPRFGADFSHVRTHSDDEAAQRCRNLNAQAFTYHQDIYFGTGRSPGNDELTAHELTHDVSESS
jgi:hypothetical protein